MATERTANWIAKAISAARVSSVARPESIRGLAWARAVRSRASQRAVRGPRCHQGRLWGAVSVETGVVLRRSGWLSLT